MVKYLNTVLTMSALVTAPLLSAATADFKSANFAFSGQDLVAKIPAASVPQKSDVLYCRADINVDGRAERANCFTKSGTQSLVVDVEQALQTLPFSVAKVEGKRVPVRMSFRVALTPTAESLAALLIPNLGTMQAQYGRNYIAPQERLDVADWYQRYSESSYVGGQEFLGEGDMSRVAATVNVDGRPALLKTLDAKRAHVRDAEIVKRTLRDARFIPGTLDGKVVPMQYVAAVHYDRGSQSVAKGK